MASTKGNEIRAAAIQWLGSLVEQSGTNVLPWGKIKAGFRFRGEEVYLASKAVGIFKPEQIDDGAPLSIKQVCPSRAGRVPPYEDRELETGVVSYRLERNGERSIYNQYLVKAAQAMCPLVYMRGVADALYEVIFPVFVRNVDFAEGCAKIDLDPLEQEAAFGWTDAQIAEPLSRRYSIGLRKTRLHQQGFRQRVLLAYGFRCALTGFPLPDLLEAAHIVSDAKGGEASVQNGIALSRLHHVAYEQNLLGIDPDGHVHLGEILKATRDGPLFEHGMLRLEGCRLRFPAFEGHHPSRAFLAEKYEEFKSARR